MRLNRRSEAKTIVRVPTRWERSLIEKHEEERFRWTMVSIGAWIAAVILWAAFS
jgi:hypothetical protein